jgi:dynein heavy chain
MHMHPDALRATCPQETRKLMETVVSIQPRSSGSAAGRGPDEVVGALAAEILEGLPQALEQANAQPGLFDRTPAGQLNSLSVVLGQEMERFNRLRAVMASSLSELQKAIKGLVVMSSELEAMYNSMLGNQVSAGWGGGWREDLTAWPGLTSALPARASAPCLHRPTSAPPHLCTAPPLHRPTSAPPHHMQVPELWARVAYPSLKPLAAWVADFKQRVAAMASWLTHGPPPCFWLPGFFFPQGFMTGVLQMHARKYALPVDSLSFQFRVTQHASGEDVPEAPADGIYVSGLWIDGARWDGAAGVLDAAPPGVMHSPLPVVHFAPVQDYEPPGDDYQCPLYKTSSRAGVLSTTGQSTNFVLCVSLPVRPGSSSDYWVLQGVALLCMLDE